MSVSTEMPLSNETTQMLRHWRELVPQDRLAHLIRDVEREQRRLLSALLAEHGVSFGHWAFLRILWTEDGLTQRQLSAMAGVMEPTTFTALKVMEEKGFIERRQLNGNRKNVHVFLTRQGRALQKKLVPLAEYVNEVSTRGISATDLSRLRKVLLTMIENIAAGEIGGSDVEADGS